MSDDRRHILSGRFIVTDEDGLPVHVYAKIEAYEPALRAMIKRAWLNQQKTCVDGPLTATVKEVKLGAAGS